MEYINYVEINKDNLKFNIDYLKKQFNYDYYILDVSNNAFGHGMYLVNFLSDYCDYFYVTTFNDISLIRKYNKNCSIIYEGLFDKNNIYDLVMNNAILVVNNIEDLKLINDQDIKDNIQIIIRIDVKGFFGVNSKNEILDMLDIINNNKYLELIGIKANINEEDYQEFKYVTSPFKNIKLFILNDESDKNKIKGSNAIKLDRSIYGINPGKKKLFSKEEKVVKQVFSLKSKITNIKSISKGNNVKYLGIVPFGYLNGLIREINRVYVLGKLRNVVKRDDNFIIIEIDSDVTLGSSVEITSNNNPIQNYINNNCLLSFNLISGNLPIVYDDYVLDKVYNY